MEISPLRQGDHLLSELSQFLCFGFGRANSFVLDQLMDEIAKQGLSVSTCTAEFSADFSMVHNSSLSRSNGMNSQDSGSGHFGLSLLFQFRRWRNAIELQAETQSHGSQEFLDLVQ